MTTRLYVNNFTTTLDGAINNSQTTITLTLTAGLPTIADATEVFFLTIDDGTNVEIIEVTAVSGFDITCVRGQEGTTPTAFLDDDAVNLNPTADSFERMATDEDLEFYDGNSISGLLSGGRLSINADPTKFDYTSGTGVIIDYYTDVNNATNTPISWSGATAVTPTHIATQNFTVIYVDDTSTVLQFAGFFGPEDTVASAVLGVLIHPDGVNIVDIVDFTFFSFGRARLLNDLAGALGDINTSGNVYSANGANLSIDKSTGTSFGNSINRDSAISPHISNDASDTTVTFTYLYQDGSGGTTFDTGNTLIVPGSYDDGDGTLGNVSNNNWSIQRIYLDNVNQDHYVAYSQNVYSTLDNARSSILTETFVSPAIVASFMLRGFLLVKGNASDLSNGSQAEFIVAANLQGAGSGSATAAIAAATLQSSYDQAADPEITLDNTKTDAGLSIIDDSTPVSGNLFEIQDDPRTTDYFSVSTTTVTLDVDLDVQANYVDIGEISTPANPAADTCRLYCKDVASVSNFFVRDSAGTEVNLSTVGGVTDHGALTGLSDDDHTIYSLISSQAGAPSSTPTRVGEVNIDTTSDNAYVSTGTASSGDWTQVNNSASSDHGSLSGLADDDHTQYTLISSQAGAPSSTPGRVGELNVDTTNDRFYISTDTSSSADWDLAVTPSSTDTLTNKTFDANGTGNSLSNVDVADLSNGTDGELITWDAAGVPAVVATGTATHVLTSNGAGTAPTFQVAAGGSHSESSTDTLTNKTIDADGTGNVITNIGSSEVKGEIITGQTEFSASFDAGVDFTWMYDDSASALRKVSWFKVNQQLDHGTFAGVSDDDHTMYAPITSQAGVPSSTPARAGAINVNTSNDDIYVASAAGSSADWELVTNAGGGGADTALSNLASVAINTSLISDTDSTDDLGSTGIRWANLWVDDITVTTNITVGGTVDGRDLATDGTKLDAIEASADVTDETNVKAALDGATIADITVATGDKILLQDIDDSDNLRTETAQAVANLADHDALTNFVANEHIDHTSVTLTAGSGLTGGGDISANRSFKVDSVINAQTTAYTAVEADRGKVIRFTGAGGVNLNVTAAATLTDGWYTTLKNDSSGDITIDPNASETVDGSTTLVVEATQAVIIHTNGTLFYTVGEAAAPGAGGSHTESSTDTLTNKTLDADGTGNVITNIGSSEVKGELITGQTEFSASFDAGVDFALMYDDSASALRKVSWFKVNQQLDHGTFAGVSDDDHTMYAPITTQAGVPASTPARAGAVNVNTSNDDIYIASAAGSSADWELVKNAAGIANVVEDTTPQLGGQLDVNGNEIQSVSSTDIVLHSDQSIITKLGTSGSLILQDLGSTEKFRVTDAGTLTLSGTVDGRDVAADGTRLDQLTTSQAGVPSSTPSNLGDINVATTGDNAYIATGTASSADWTQVNQSQVLIATATASASATIDFDNVFDSTYVKYILEFYDCICATDGVDFWMRVGVGATPTYKSGASDYSRLGAVAVNDTIAQVVVNQTTRAIDNLSPHSFSGMLTIHNPSATATLTDGSGSIIYQSNAAADIRQNGVGWHYNTAEAVTSLRLQMSSGNITSGEFRLYGLIG